MPLVNFYIDKDIYKKALKLVENGVFDNPATLFQVALMLIIKVFEECVKRGIEREVCLERCFEFIFEK